MTSIRGHVQAVGSLPYAMQCKENSVYMVSEDRILNLFSFSIAPIRPSQEAKLFPVLEKVLNLLLRQVRYHGNFSEVVPHLTSLATGMTRFGEDKATEGILGVIGLGKKSCYSHQYVLLLVSFPNCVSLLRWLCLTVTNFKIITRLQSVYDFQQTDFRFGVCYNT